MIFSLAKMILMTKMLGRAVYRLRTLKKFTLMVGEALLINIVQKDKQLKILTKKYIKRVK
jgi:hypothetical protein